MAALELPKSYEKVNYLLRPSKQVERKLFVEAMHRLAKAGYDVSKYTYFGLGSVYFVDFILFHKYLYINNMICVEGADIAKRMEFNVPYGFIDLQMGLVSDIIPTLERDTRYFAWLDYDRSLDLEVTEDVDGFLTILKPGSVLIVTIEAEPDVPTEIDEDGLSADDIENCLLDFYRTNFGDLLLGEIGRSDLARNELPRLLGRLLRAQVSRSILQRSGLCFHELFNLVYSDGTQMYTFGGIIDTEGAGKGLAECGVYDLAYIKPGGEPVRISVPPLTPKEKIWLDHEIDRRDGAPLDAENLKFELEQELLESYKRYYKHYPTYHEAIL